MSIKDVLCFGIRRGSSSKFDFAIDLIPIWAGIWILIFDVLILTSMIIELPAAHATISHQPLGLFIPFVGMEVSALVFFIGFLAFVVKEGRRVVEIRRKEKLRKEERGER